MTTEALVCKRNPYPEPDRSDGPLVWKVSGSDFSDYLVDFKNFIKSSKVMDHVEKLKYVRNPVIIDLMSSTHALQDLYLNYLDMNPIAGLAVSPDDIRSSSERECDDIYNITHLNGNLRDPQTWKDMNAWLNGRKASLIMSRPFAGLRYIPTRPLFYKSVMTRLWDMLDSDGGMMMLQTPEYHILESCGIPVKSWMGALKQEGIYCQGISSYVSTDFKQRYGLVMLQRRPHHNVLPELPSS